MKVLWLLILVTTCIFAQAQGIPETWSKRSGADKIFFESNKATAPSGLTPVPSTGLIYAWDVESDKGSGKNTFGTNMTSLVSATVLTLVNTPTDSTAFGFIFFDGAGFEIGKTTTTITLGPDFTVVMKFRAYDAPATWANIWQADDATKKLGGVGWCCSINANCYDYRALTGGAVGNYYNNWFLQADDSVTTWTSEGDMYRDGVLRVDASLSMSGSVTDIFSIMGTIAPDYTITGRFYYIYIYNRVLSPAEIAIFNEW